MSDLQQADKVETAVLLSLLEHWREARTNRLYDNRIALSENLRCAVDVADILRGAGVRVPKELYKHKSFLR